MRQFALLDQRAGAPTPAINDLFIGEHGLVDGIPVHLGLLARDQTGVEKVQKQPLLMLVIGRIAGRDLARPVQRQAHRLELTAHGRDILIRPFGRVAVVLHGRVFSGHAEGIPAHRVQDVEATGALVAGHHVAHRIIADVTHMDAARRIGEHFKHIIFRARVVVICAERLEFSPYLLPFRFSFA